MGAFHSTKNSEISGSILNGTVKIPGKVFENLGIRFECTLFVGISGIIENFVFHSQEMSGLVSLPSVGARTIQFSSLFATIQRNSSICFSGKIAGRPDKLPVGFRPVCFISCVNNPKWFSNSPDKYAGIVTSKYPFTRVNSFRIKQATAARSITSSLRSRMVQLIVRQSPCSKAAKMFKKSASFTQHALCCKHVT